MQRPSGYWIAQHRRATLVACLGVALVAMIGFVNIRFESDGIDLWVPPSSTAVKNMDTLDDVSSVPDFFSHIPVDLCLNSAAHRCMYVCV
jgi:predicted RND superfamily exporter protein